MARMISDIDSSLIENEGERIVYRELQAQLPREWTVRFHYPYCKHANGYLRDGEADFVVIAPGRGVLFLEVKASHGYDSEGGIWYRIRRDGGREKTTNPFDQVCRVKHELIELVLCARLGCSKLNFPGIFGHAVVYPKARVEGRLPSSQDPQVIIAYKDMGSLRERLENAFDAWGHQSRGSTFTPAVAGLVVEVMRDASSFIAVAAADTDDIDRKIEQLTRQQYDTYIGLLANRRALVSGRAGSGKTMLALWTARALAAKKRVLFLCFNRTLAVWLQRSEVAVKNLDIANFHSLCAKLANRAQIQWNPPQESTSDFWAFNAPNMLADALDRLTLADKYDAIVVDEGQDFHPNWWIPVELLLRSEGEGNLYIFYDPDQAIQNIEDGCYPSIATSFRLETNCRNTRLVAKYCGKVIAASSRSRDGAPEGVAPVVEAFETLTTLRSERVKSVVKKWLEDGYRPSRIAVLSPFRSGGEASSLTSLSRDRVETIPFESSPDGIDRWLDGKAFWASTIKSFKGLEVDCLVVTDIPGQESSIFSRRDLYVGVSRAKHHAVLIPMDESGHRLARSFL